MKIWNYGLGFEIRIEIGDWDYEMGLALGFGLPLGMEIWDRDVGLE